MENTKNITGGKKALLIVGIALAAIIALLFTVLLSLHIITPVLCNDFFADAKAEYVTPGLYEGLVPQGYAYVGEHNVYLQCGYMTDGKSASRIYVTDAKDTSDSYYVELCTEDGKPYTGHTGGMTSTSGFVWLVNDGEGEDNCVWVISLNDILSAKNGDNITLSTKFQSETRAACCFVDDKYLWVGEFNDGEKYVTKDTHAFTVNGEENNALICAYALDTSSKYGIKYQEVEGKDTFTPELALSVTDLVQGFTKIPNGFVLSTSYALTASHLYFYKDPTTGEADATIKINGKDIPVYFLDELTNDVKMPPMSEEIFVKGDRIYILFESACLKYVFGNFTHGIHIYSYGIN